MSITDEVYGQFTNKIESGASEIIRSVPGTANEAVDLSKKIIQEGVAGIALVFKAPVFTAEYIMKAIGKITNDPQYASQNISIEELSKNSDIKQIDAAMTKDKMRHFDKACKKYGVKYNAVVDRSDKKEPTYYVFFQGKETQVIEQAMKESYKSYVKEQVSPRLSVKAKLAFFRSKVAEKAQMQRDSLGKEKRLSRSELQH